QRIVGGNGRPVGERRKVDTSIYDREAVNRMDIALWEDSGTVMTPYLLEDDGPHPVVIVCPGGGYGMRAAHEGEPVARWLNSAGVSAFVLHYSVAPAQYPTALREAQRAIRTIRARAAEWRLDPARVGILGFSAGGHLASTAGLHYDSGKPDAADPIERQSSRPDLMVLCYPVITMGEYTHEGSRSNLLGGRRHDPAMIELLSG